MTPALPDEAVFAQGRPAAPGDLRVDIDDVVVEGDLVRFTATVSGEKAVEHTAYVDGARVDTTLDGDRLRGEASIAADVYGDPVSEWVQAYGPLVVVVVRASGGATVGAVSTASPSPL